MTEPPKIRLRKSSGEDLDFAWQLFRDLMKPLTVDLLDWHEPKQQNMVQEALLAVGTSIVTIKGSRTGWLQLNETADEVYLAQLYIEPEIQNQGIGTAIGRQLCDRARRQGKTLRLDIMTNNRARTLYERLGFSCAGETQNHHQMEWLPPTG